MSKKRRAAAAPPQPAKRGWRSWQTCLVAAILVGVTCFVYAPVRHYDFVELDDPLYVSENPHIAGGLSLENVTWAFTRQHGGYWIPVTWLSYMADVEVFGGVDAGGHHVTNVLLHVANTLLLFGLLARTTRAPIRSAVVAALFALHPLHVESVAWVTERKDVLSTLFWFLGLWAYAWYARRPGWRRYLAIVACMALGLLAKPMLVTFPFLLLLMDVWPLGRVKAFESGWRDWKPLVVEKLPILALAIGASVVAYGAQQAVGAAPTFQAVPLGLRLQNAVVSYAVYLRMMMWPRPLTVIYPLPPSFAAAAVAGASAFLVAVTALVLWFGRHRPYLPVGWFWYLGTMVPVIGIVQVGSQARADRFTYVPLIGVFVMAVWACAEFAGTSRWKRSIAASLAAVVVAAAGVQANSQLACWQNSVTLWTHAVENTLGMSQFDAHRSLGRILAGKGRLAEARDHFEAAVAIDPSSVDTRHDLARVFVDLQQPDKALPNLQQVVRDRPGVAETHAELGEVLTMEGQFEAALREYQEALRLEPDIAGVHNNIGTLLAQQARYADAVPYFEEAARRGPDVETARVNLGLAMAKTGRTAEARAIFLQVLRQHPGNAVARRSLEELSGR